MSNSLKSVLSGVVASPGTVTVAANSTISGSLFNNGITFTQPVQPATISIKGVDGKESAEFDAAFINDLKLLLEVINELPDDHPMGELKHDMRMRRAFKRLGG